jgi:hypothetical protein
MGRARRVTIREEPAPMYGVMAEFDTADALLAATRAAFDDGYRRMDAYAPFAVEGLAEALGARGTVVPWITLAGGVCGAIAGYAFQFWVHVVALPINVGGRPLHSWPMFIPVTFEMAVLGAGLATLVALLILNRLPQPYHPVFNVPAFARASRDRFFLCIEASDPRFEADRTTGFLATLGPTAVSDVPE